MPKGLQGFQKGHGLFSSEDIRRKKISESMKGKIPKNFKEIQRKGWEARKGVPMTGKREIGWKLSEETKRKIRKNSAKIWLGKNLTKEAKKKISDALMGQYMGEKSPNWIRDRTKLKNYNQRQNSEYNYWRKAVYKRDDYRCLDCGARGSENGKKVILNADHIYSWKDYPRMRYEMMNGQTLCKSCHRNKTIFERTGVYKIV